MVIALRELVRRPSRFVPVVVATSLLVVLLAVLAGFLDGLERSQTGVVRAQEGRLLVVAADADLAPTRSTLPEEALEAVADVDGVADVGRLSQIVTTARPEGGEVVDVVLVGYDLATDDVPAPAGGDVVHVDERLGAVAGTPATAVPAVGPGGECCDAVGEVLTDVSAGAPSIWVAHDRWEELAAAADPTAPVRLQALVVEPAADADPATLAEAVQDALAGTVEVDVATPAAVVDANEVVTQQSATFTGIIGVTFLVTLLVVALFFVLLTIERTRLYAVLKAVGGRTGDLLGGLAAQAVAVALASLLVGGAIVAALLPLVPADLPVVVLPERLAVLAVAVVVVAVVGALTTLRRLLRVDPASAIG